MSSVNDENAYFAALIMDGGHFAHAMSSVTTKCAKKYNVNPQEIQVSLDLIIAEIENQFDIKFSLYQLFFYQGTFTGQPNEFHKRLKRNNIHVGIHEMKKQRGKNTEVIETEPNKPSVVITFLKAQKFLVFITCGLLLVPIPILLKLIMLACVICLEVYHEIRFFDIFQFKNSEVTIPKNGKATIWVERGVDVQIATKIIECSHGLNGNTKPSKLIVITGDSDLKSAFMCANNASNMAGNIIVLAEDNCLAGCLLPYLPDNKQITLENIMEACLIWSKGGGLVVPRLRVSAAAIVSKTETITTAPIQNDVIVSPVVNIASALQTIAILSSADASLEIALALHEFIATKYENKPFFSVDMAFFYTSGNEQFKQYIQKYKIKSICDTWPQLLKLDWSVPSKGARVLLADSERSQELVNNYFNKNSRVANPELQKVTLVVKEEFDCDALLVNLKPTDDLESRLLNQVTNTTYNIRDEYRNEPGDNYRNEPGDNYRNEPGDNYRNESKDNYRNESRDNYRNESRDNYRNESRDNYRNEPGDNYRNEPGDNYRNESRDNYRNESRDNYRNEPKDNYRNEPKDNYRNEPRDNYRNEPRSSRRIESKTGYQSDNRDKHTYRNTVSSRRNEPKTQPPKVQEVESDDFLLLMRQMKVVWDGAVPIRHFLSSKCEILEQLNIVFFLSVEETLNLIKNCFEDDMFETCFSNFELKYIKTSYRSVSNLRKDIIKVVDNHQIKYTHETEQLNLTPELSLETPQTILVNASEQFAKEAAEEIVATLIFEEENVLFLHEDVVKISEEDNVVVTTEDSNALLTNDDKENVVLEGEHVLNDAEKRWSEAEDNENVALDDEQVLLNDAVKRWLAAEKLIKVLASEEAKWN